MTTQPKTQTLIQAWANSKTGPFLPPRVPFAQNQVIPSPPPPETILGIQGMSTWEVDTDDQLRALYNRNDPNCPFHGWVAQDNAIRQLTNIIATARRDKHHRLPNATALLHIGMRSSGKTQAAEVLFSPFGLDLPYVKVNAKEIRGIETILRLLSDMAEEAGFPLVATGHENGRTLHKAPPCGFIIDEIHGLSAGLMDELLNMLEADDSTLSTPDCVVNVHDVVWVGCTTEHGTLFDKHDAFESRFEKIDFEGYTRDQVAQILQYGFPAWGEAECQELAVRSGRIVREAKKMAAKVEREWVGMKLFDADTERMDAIIAVGEQMHVDEYGMTDKQLKALVGLAKRHPKGMTLGQLAQTVGDKEDKVKNLVLPSLELDTTDHPAMVCRPSRTFITKAGMQELVRRGLLDITAVENFDA